MINILFTSSGRRVELIERFRIAKEDMGIKGRIVCSDMNRLAPTLQFSDRHYLVPPIKDEQYIPTLLDICKKEKINLLISTIDTELHLLSQIKEQFEAIGTKVLISSEETVKICEDKINTFNFFKKLGLNTPNSFVSGQKEEVEYPCFIKPLNGSSSINTFKVKNEEELVFFKKYIGNYIIQDFIDGIEYTVDIMCDFEGNPIFITPRIRLATRGGEVIQTLIVEDESIEKECLKIIEALKPVGPITVQLIQNKTTGKNYYIEINARFGGGSPLSMAAGADSERIVYKLLQGIEVKPNYRKAKSGQFFARFDESVLVKSDEVDE